MLIIADHASNAVPPELMPFGVSAAEMQRHIAWDIGTAELARQLSDMLDCPAVMAPWSRLVVDVNRDAGHAGLIPAVSDGTPIPRNADISADERARRIAAYYNPYHQFIAEEIAAHQPKLLLSLHSFTPEMQGFKRPWHVGLLYNKDNRAARVAIDWFRQKPELVVGDNEPYSGKDLNYTMDRHGEANGIPYLSLEIRQDLLGDAAAVAGWVGPIARLVAQLA
jgi:predicted N-formylglutamate amidohydrolase